MKMEVIFYTKTQTVVIITRDNWNTEMSYRRNVYSIKEY